MSDLYATFTSLEGGMNSGFDAAVISDNQYALGINVVCRRGRPSTRPDFDRIPLQFENDDEKKLFEEGRFQGGDKYSPGFANYVVALIGGWIFVIDLSNYSVKRMSNIPQMSTVAKRGFFCQVVDQFVVQDGLNRPAILTNQSAKVSDASKNQVPAGKAMAFGHGRLFVQISKRDFIAGDIHKQAKHGSALIFEEDQYLSEGGSFSVAPELGAITGMHFATHFDTSTGDGPLMVVCENGAATYSVQNSRTFWNDNDLSKVQMVGTGIVGQCAKVNVNQDMMFWSWGGLRSWAAVQQEALYQRKYTNQSAEILEITKDDTGFLLPYMSMIQFNNRLLITSVGEKAQCFVDGEWAYEDVSFKCIVSLDFDQINNQIKTKSRGTAIAQSASYDGIWTGIHPTQLLTLMMSGTQRAFAFDKARSGKNRFWEITDNYTGYDNKVHKIECELYTKTYVGFDASYNEQPFVAKRVFQIQLWVANILGKLPVTVSVKNDRSLRFNDLQTREILSKTWMNELVNNEVVTGIPQNRSALPFEDFTESFDPVSKQYNHSGYELAFRIAWKGYAEMSRLFVMMTSEGQEQYQSEDETMLVSELPNDKYKYRV